MFIHINWQSLLYTPILMTLYHKRDLKRPSTDPNWVTFATKKKMYNLIYLSQGSGWSVSHVISSKILLVIDG